MHWRELESLKAAHLDLTKDKKGKNGRAIELSLPARVTLT